MLMLRLIIPMAIVNAVILIIAMTFVIRAATESVDVIRDYSIVIQALMKEPAKRFNIKQQLEAYRTKNVIVTIAYISMLFLVIHSIVNMITAARTPCGPLLTIRLLCEHITSAIRVYFCLIGCLIYTAIVAIDLTVCMPTPTFPMIYQYTKGSKMLSLNTVNKSEIAGGSFLPTTDSTAVSKRSINKLTSNRPNRIRSICKYCDLLRSSQEVPINEYFDVCKFYNSIREESSMENKKTSRQQILDISEQRQLILSCDGGKTYVSLAALKPLKLKTGVFPKSINSENKRIIRDATDEPEEPDKGDDKEKYENIIFETKEKHYERCQRMQELLSPGLGLVFICLTCMSKILLMSRCERTPCLCGYRKSKCVCEIKVCACRTRGAGSPLSSKISSKTKLTATPHTEETRSAHSAPSNKINVPQTIEAEITNHPSSGSRAKSQIITESIERDKIAEDVLPKVFGQYSPEKSTKKGMFKKMTISFKF